MKNSGIKKGGESPLNKFNYGDFFEKILLTDCDGVLLNWLADFYIFMRDRGYTPKEIKTYELEKLYHMPKDKINFLIKEFNSSDQMCKLSPLRKSEIYLKEFKNMGYDIVCISSMSDIPNDHEKRIINLSHVFGENLFNDYYFLGLGESKYDILKKYKDYDDVIWVEDNVINAIDGLMLGYRVFLIDHPYNNKPIHDKYFKELERVNDWKDILEKVGNG